MLHRFFIFLFCFVIVCQGRPAENTEHNGKILEYVNDIYPEGNYVFRFHTDDGTQREESGKLETDGKEGVLRVHGSYEFLGQDGKIYRVTYDADENGYRSKTQHNAGAVTGDVRTVSSGISTAVLKSLVSK